MPRFWQAEKIDFHFTDCRCLCFQFKRKNIADHSQWIMLIPDFVAFFFMSLSLFSVESLQHLILRSLNSWNFYLIIQQYAKVKFEKKKCFTDINLKYYLCLSWVSWIRWKIYVTGKNIHYPVPSDRRVNFNHAEILVWLLGWLRLQPSFWNNSWPQMKLAIALTKSNLKFIPSWKFQPSWNNNNDFYSHKQLELTNVKEYTSTIDKRKDFTVCIMVVRWPLWRRKGWWW